MNPHPLHSFPPSSPLPPPTIIMISSTFLIHLASALVQFLYAGFQILAFSAISINASPTSSSSSSSVPTIFLSYRNAIAAFSLAPFAFFLERNIRPSLTVYKLLQFFFSAFIGVCVNQVIYLAGLHHTSATFTATMQNITPALTFALAALLRIETIGIRTRRGQAKVLGMVVAVGGATLIALYKDRSDLQLLTFLRGPTESPPLFYDSWLWGVVCLLGNCLTWAMWFILQSPIMKDYPSHLSATAFTYTFGCMQLASMALFSERDLSIWISTFHSDRIAILYGGLLTSGVGMTLQAWCAYKGGPILVAAYQPLQAILVAILSSVFLGETVSFHSFIGGLLIVIGLYLVLWGKLKEGSVYSADCRPTLIRGRDIERVTEQLQPTSTIGNDVEGLTEALLHFSECDCAASRSTLIIS